MFKHSVSSNGCVVPDVVNVEVVLTEVVCVVAGQNCE